MAEPITVILSGKWAVADIENVQTATHITLYEVDN